MIASNSGRKSSPPPLMSVRGRASLGIGVEHREIDLIFLRIQIDEQVVDFV